MNKFIKYIGFCIFVVFAVLQFNDPDPFIWTSIYGGTAIISLINFSKLDKIIYFMFGFIFSVCINTIVELHSISEINSLELIFEFSGLLICIIWLLYLKKTPIIET
jgi:hypothetical protein